MDDSVLKRQHADDAATGAVILELDRPVDLREERVETAARAAARESIRR